MAHLRQGEKSGSDWPLADVATVLTFGPDGSCRDAAVGWGRLSRTRAWAAERLGRRCAGDARQSCRLHG